MRGQQGTCRRQILRTPTRFPFLHSLCNLPGWPRRVPPKDDLFACVAHPSCCWFRQHPFPTIRGSRICAKSNGRWSLQPPKNCYVLKKKKKRVGLYMSTHFLREASASAKVVSRELPSSRQTFSKRAKQPDLIPTLPHVATLYWAHVFSPL